jgi:alpha-tubulin suppressor-like RCC1 family protein
MGQIFSFGVGLQGQLGVGQKVLKQYCPTEIVFPTKKREKIPFITTIKGRCYDSAGIDSLN